VRQLRLSFIILLSLLISTSAIARPDEALNGRLTDAVFELYKLDRNKAEIEIVRNPLDVSAVEYDRIDLQPLSKAAPSGLLSLKADLLKNGEAVGSGQIRVRVSYFDSVLVSTDRARRYDILNKENCRIERRDVTSLTERALTSFEELEEVWLTRNIGKGQIITAGMVEKVPPVKYGQQVLIVYKTSCFEISVPGTARETGYEGDEIKVKNNQSLKIITCTVIDSEQVQVASY
jgi:flagella basal body P-ring formation protein FlgA